MGPASLRAAAAFRRQAVSRVIEDRAAELHDGVERAHEAPAQKVKQTKTVCQHETS